MKIILDLVAKHSHIEISKDEKFMALVSGTFGEYELYIVNKEGEVVRSDKWNCGIDSMNSYICADDYLTAYHHNFDVKHISRMRDILLE